MQINNLKLELITVDDLEWARDLRNDNKQYFFNNTIVTEKDHDDWFIWFSSQDQVEFFVIWVDNQRAGTISVERAGGFLKLGNIIIAESFRHQGIFRKVLEKLRLEYGTRKFELEVRADNEQAIEAYTALGFKPLGIRMRL